MDNRLKKEKDFNLVLKKGKRLYSNSLTLVYFPADCLKVGYAVSKKNGSSVIRNKIKRYLRESFRSFAPQVRKNFFFVFMPKIKDEYIHSEFIKDMGYLLNKGNLLEKKEEKNDEKLDKKIDYCCSINKNNF